MDCIAATIGQHLELDMPGVAEELLHVDRLVAERRHGLRAGNGDRVHERGLGMHDAHAAATAATRSLDDHGISELPGDADVLVDLVAERPV
jgi:hypothetical protein